MCKLTDTDICSVSGGSGGSSGGSSGGDLGTGVVGSVTFEVTVQYDAYPTETGLYITDSEANNFILAKYPGHYATKNGKKTYTNINIQQGRSYWLFMEDTYGDGFCCLEGNDGFANIKAIQNGKVIWNMLVSGSMPDGRKKTVQFSVPSF